MHEQLVPPRTGGGALTDTGGHVGSGQSWGRGGTCPSVPSLCVSYVPLDSNAEKYQL